MNLIRIENKNHRLGKDRHYYYYPSARWSGSNSAVLFTFAELLAATKRANKAMGNPLAKQLLPGHKKATFFDWVRAVCRKN